IEDGTLGVDAGAVLVTAAVDLHDDTTLDVAGTLEAAGGAPAAITGSAGANTVLVNMGATLRGVGTLGDGVDVLDVLGTLDTGGGALSLGAGDDVFLIHDGTTVHGTIDGGDGNDTRVYNIDLVADVGAMVGFEAL